MATSVVAGWWIARRPSGNTASVTPGTGADDPASESFPLPSDGTAASAARAHVRVWLLRWDIRGVIEPLTLIASELVGNAVRHGRPPLEMLLRRAGSAVRIDVHDEMPSREPALPATLPTDPDAESGRGMILVQALSTDVGVEQIDDDGKRVWAVVDPSDEA